MNVLSYLQLSRALTEDEEKSIRLQIHNCNLIINKLTSSAANAEAHLALLANSGNWREHQDFMNYIKHRDESVASVCGIYFH
jgi:hypothetical protein